MIRSIAILLVLASVAAAAADRARVVLVFKQEADVEVGVVTLGDIAEVRTDDAALRERLQRFKVDQAPRNGQRLVQRRPVLRDLTQSHPSIDFVARGTTHTLLDVDMRTYSGSRLLEAARAHLMRELRREVPALTRIEIEPVGAVVDLRVPRGDVVLVPRRQGAEMAKRVCVWVGVYLDGTLYRRIPIWLALRAYAPALVAQRAITPREPVDAKDFVREERDIAGVRGSVLHDPPAEEARRARTYIALGAVLRAQDLERAPSVVVDQRIDVRVAFGAVEIETKAVAEEEGYVGEYIRVRNPSSADTFMARVIGAGSVVVTTR